MKPFPVVLIAAALVLSAGPSRADEIVFKKEFGGEKVKCEIYKETDDYIHYIDVKQKMDCGCSREIVEKIVREKKPLLDVEAFFLKKAKDAKDAKAREKAERLAEELRKRREADAAKNPDESEGKRVGKCLIKPSTEQTGIKVLPTRDTGSKELLVDPFPEEDKPSEPAGGGSGKK